MKIERIGILTGGGDCPGLNPVIRAVVRTAIKHFGWEVWGIGSGFEGLAAMNNVYQMNLNDVRGILHRGGTILGSASGSALGRKAGRDSQKGKRYAVSILTNFKRLELHALVVIGGDGTLSFAQELYEMGIPVVGIPKTIDNDLSATGITFGFDTAVDTATDALDKLHTTAESHQRVMVVELMGRYVGWIALHAGVAGGADVILIPEIPFDIDKICKHIEGRRKKGGSFSVVVVAEGAQPKKGPRRVKKTARRGKVEVLGGIGAELAVQIEKRTGFDTRTTVLGHLQRGGVPSSYDRVLATRFGAAAVYAIAEGAFGTMVALRTPDLCRVPLTEATQRLKSVPLDYDLIRAARDLGISLGD